MALNHERAARQARRLEPLILPVVDPVAPSQHLTDHGAMRTRARQIKSGLDTVRPDLQFCFGLVLGLGSESGFGFCLGFTLDAGCISCPGFLLGVVGG